MSLRVAAQPLSLETALGMPILPANQPLVEVQVGLHGEARQWAEAKTRVEWLEILPSNGYRNVSAAR